MGLGVGPCSGLGLWFQASNRAAEEAVLGLGDAHLLLDHLLLVALPAVHPGLGLKVTCPEKSFTTSKKDPGLGWLSSICVASIVASLQHAPRWMRHPSAGYLSRLSPLTAGLRTINRS